MSNFTILSDLPFRNVILSRSALRNGAREFVRRIISPLERSLPSEKEFLRLP